jgi:hypothetical protein
MRQADLRKPPTRIDVDVSFVRAVYKGYLQEYWAVMIPP